MIKRTERGWGGHFICADRCLFRRNTLLEKGETKIVISTVGLMRDIHNLQERRFEQVGCNRYFETMVFYADLTDKRFYDADVMREVSTESNWCINEIDADDKANDMHEVIVQEIAYRMIKGEFDGNI